MLFGLFDDPAVSRFFPLTYSRSFAHLRTGPLTPAEQLQVLTGNRFWGVKPASHLITYYQHTGQLPVLFGEPVLFINSRIRHLATILPLCTGLTQPGDSLTHESDLIAIVIGPDQLMAFFTSANPDSFVKKSESVSAGLFNHSWEVVLDSGLTIEDQASFLINSGRFNSMEKSFRGAALGDHCLWISPSAIIHPFVSFDLRKGPIFLDDQTEVMSHTLLSGPLYVGPGSKVKAGSTFYPNTIIGPVCKVGGEVEDVIIQGYSNKQHAGFLGHSFLGSWCNLGADTNNSDLKNTYAPVDLWESGKMVSTGSIFMGLIMGDHSKTGINTMLNTGTVVGFSSMVFGAGFPDRFIPSFHWSADGKLIPFRLNKAIETARAVMGRRSVPFTDADQTLFEDIRNLAVSEHKTHS